MTKLSALGATVTIDDELGSGTAISNDVLSLTFNTPVGSFDVTGIDKSAMERLQGLQGFDISLTMAFNQGGAHTVFESVWSNAVDRTVVLQIGSQTLTVECKFSDYTITRGADGSLNATADGEVSNAVAHAWT